MPGGSGVRDVTKGGCYGGARGAKSSDTTDCGVGEEDREAAISGEGEMPTEKVGHTQE